MKIDLKERIKSPIFWINNIMAIVVPILAYYKASVNDFTTWESIFDLVLSALKNPYVLGLVFVSLWNNIVHPKPKTLVTKETGETL